MKIAVFEGEAWERESFESLQQNHEVVFVDAELNEENAAEYKDAEVISTFIYSDLSQEILGQFDALKLIATRSTGVDHIDKDYCQQNDITVCNVPKYGENTVAEHVFGLLLTISHRIWDGVDRTRKGDFSFVGLQGFDLMGKTIGVIGTGDIGRHAIRIAKGFGMEVLAYDVKPDEEFARAMDFKYVELGELLEHSDVLTLHVPATDATIDLIAQEEFGKMKQGAVLINTSRGAIVNVRAMIEALAQGRLAAAGLDVLPMEPVIREEAELLRSVFQREHDLESLLADHVLLRLRNIYITPHTAFNTREAVERILEVTVENIQSFINGDPQNTAWK